MYRDSKGKTFSGVPAWRMVTTFNLFYSHLLKAAAQTGQMCDVVTQQAVLCYLNAVVKIV